MSFLRKACRFLFKALEWFAMICMVCLTIIVFTDVILRYIFKRGFAWTQEIATLMLVWFSLIGMAIGVLEKIHISIEMFTSKLPDKALSVLESINHLLIAVFGGCMVYFGLIIMNMTKMSTLPATKMPSSVLYVILPLSGLLVLVNAILVAAKQDKKLFADENSQAGEDMTNA
ncbi:TRAP transporter small permease [Oscillibacter valericigenes]|uniref:TRAP transporter small permease n=1 Tax=Oscillibacter valericigenes TaxID=351091 RepID=UPI001F3A2D92|nr:TRAP transporter small permease [Oscillibacter valericigenes]MCF2665104.1 TRAP transporter small permease [Oscillibacter valericigenes]